MSARARSMQGGYVLVTALILALVVGAFVAISAQLAVSDVSAAAASRARTQALQAAYSAAQMQIEAVQTGGGTAALAGGFAGATYTALPARSLGNRCWSITATATYERETRAVELIAGPRPYPQLRGAFGMQGGGVLTAIIALSGWRVSGHDTRPPSVSGDTTWNDLGQVGTGPEGPAAVPGMVVANGLEKTVIALQMLLGSPSRIDGQNQSGSGSATGMNTVAVVSQPANDLASEYSALRSGATVISSNVGAGSYGTATAPARVVLDSGARLSSLTGNGVLMITSGNVQISGPLHWEGLVILRSTDLLDLSSVASGEVRIYGGVVAEDPNHLVLALGTARLRVLYSSEAMARVFAVYPGNGLIVRASRVLR